MPEKEPARYAVSEGLLIAIVPVIGYALAYAYEFGYCSVFSIPEYLIQVGLSNVLIAIGSLIVLLNVFSMASLPYSFLAPSLASSPVARSFARVLALAFLFICLMFLSEPTRVEVAAYAVIILMLVMLEFVFPLFTNRGKSSYSEKLAGQEEIEATTHTIYDLLAHKVGWSKIHLVAFILLFLFFSGAAGRGAARRQKDFLVPESTPQFVVLRQYADYFILGRLSENAESVTPEFRFVRLSEQDLSRAEVFTVKHIGPLSSAPVEPSAEQPTPEGAPADTTASDSASPSPSPGNIEDSVGVVSDK